MPDGIVLQNEVCQYTIGTDGKNRALVDLADQQDYSPPAAPFMLAGQESKTLAASKVKCNGDVLTVYFADSPCTVTAKVEIRPRYFTLTVTDVAGGEVDWLQLANLRVKMTENVGGLVNAAWNDHFAACVLACNAQVDCGSHGVPRLAPTASSQSREPRWPSLACRQEEPTHPTSSWMRSKPSNSNKACRIRRSTACGLSVPRRFASYLMVSGVNQHNIDQVIEFARGGFGCIEVFWEKSTPSTRQIPSNSPMALRDSSRSPTRSTQQACNWACM